MPVLHAAHKPGEARLEPLLAQRHLDAVLEVENAAYPHPWQRHHFSDSLRAGYHAQVLLGCTPRAESALIGYFVAMQGVDEVHLLNITVAPRFQRQGWALVMLDALALWAQNQPGVGWLWLEVRPSNTRAQSVYERYGFRLMGRRRNYYPAGTASAPGLREDALVMGRRLG